MDKRKTNSILIAAAVCIWGILIYQFVAPYFTETKAELIAEMAPEPMALNIQKKDTVQLSFPSRDPFLGKTKSKAKQVKSVAKRVRKPKTITKPVIWPKIQYLGFVKSKNSQGKLGLVRIDGKLHRSNVNTEVDGLRIKEITNDEVVITNGREERSYSKK